VENHEEQVRALLAMHPGGTVKVAYPWGDRVFEESYKLVKKEGGAEELQVQQFVTDQMTIMCGEVNPLDSIVDAKAKYTGALASAQRERMASQRALDDLMLKFSALQDERDNLIMDLEDITRLADDLHDKLHPKAELTPEQAKLVEDLGTETSRFIHEKLHEEGWARKVMPPRDVPTEFASEGGPDDPPTDA
jgi:hypothetical protein